ncbi:MAG: N-glycosylase/DNA lyase [Verrucomicrobiota bacterium]|jgi:N-glycosylase/DNA lyase
MELTHIAAADFDLAMTLDSGQVFHWARKDRGFVGAIAETAVYIQQEGDSLKFAGASAKTIARYFALDHALLEICASFPDDAIMNEARDFCRGLRIIRQPKWECLATFICSSMKQVAHIRQISDALRQRFGKAKQICAHKIFTFPSAERLACATEKELRECALGYRAKNLLGTAQRIAADEADLEAWSKLPDSALRTQLCQLPGVGAKVANCVMLFAYERVAAFPIDVWIERVLRQQYFAGKKKVTSKTMAEFAESYFGPHGGYAQQYLFHHARMAKRKQV